MIPPSAQLLDQSSYDLMKVFEVRIPIVIICKADSNILLQPNLCCGIFNDVGSTCRVRLRYHKRSKAFTHARTDLPIPAVARQQTIVKEGADCCSRLP